MYSPIDQSSQYKLYPYRHLVTLLFVLAIFSTSLLMNTTVPQAADIALIFGLSPSHVNLAGLIYLLMHPIFTFPAAYVIERHGTRTSVVIGSILSIAGASIRLLVNKDYNWVLLGQVIAGIGRPFIVNNQAKISSNWYFASKRASVTSFFSLMINVSIIAGLLVPGLFFASFEYNPEKPQEGRQLTQKLMQIELWITLLFLIPSIILMRDKPPTPPSEPKSQTKLSFKNMLADLGRQKNYVLLLLSYLMYFGVFNAIAMNLSFLVRPWFGANSADTSLIGASPVISGILGVAIICKLQRKQNKLKKYIIICVCGSSACILLFYPALSTHSLLVACLISMANSFFLIPLIPMMLELSCQLAYPVGEGAAVSFMIAAGNLGGFLLGYLMSLIVKGETKLQSAMGLLMVIIVFGVGLIMLVFVKEEKKRQEAERQSYMKRKSNMESLRENARTEDYTPPQLVGAFEDAL